MAHGNRWFTELKNGDSPIFPVRYVSHNQRVVGCFFLSFWQLANHCWLIPSRWFHWWMMVNREPTHDLATTSPRSWLDRRTDAQKTFQQFQVNDGFCMGNHPHMAVWWQYFAALWINKFSQIIWYNMYTALLEQWTTDRVIFTTDNQQNQMI